MINYVLFQRLKFTCGIHRNPGGLDPGLKYTLNKEKVQNNKNAKQSNNSLSLDCNEAMHTSCVTHTYVCKQCLNLYSHVFVLSVFTVNVTFVIVSTISTLWPKNT